MVRLRRLELPRGVNPTATSTLRVYQFRHSRTLFLRFGQTPCHLIPPIASKIKKPVKSIRQKIGHQNQDASKSRRQKITCPHPRNRHRGGAYCARHFMEQPMDGVCSAGPAPVLAIWRIASRSSALRSPLAPIFKSSSRPR